MSRQFDADVWKPWTSVQTGRGAGGIQFSNRSVTPSFLCEDAEGLTLPAEFGKHEEKLVQEGTHRYVEDNQVDLLEHIQKDNISRSVC